MKVEDSKTNEGNCICTDCPSYPGSDELLYCARGKSVRKTNRKGCVCSACQVYVDYDLSSDYYCAIGAAR